jgi:two-component system sensor histidine kinase AgrC
VILALIIVDIIASILQSMALAYTISYCTGNDKKIAKIKIIFMTILFIFVGCFFSQTYGNSFVMTVFVTHILSLGVVIAFYRKNIVNALASYTIIYSIFAIYSIIFGNLIFEYINKILSKEYMNLEIFFIIYVPQLIVLFICFKYKNKIKQIYKTIIYEGFFINALIISFVLDFIITFYLITLGKENQLLKNIIYLMFFIFFVGILLYFWNVNQKSKQIYKLNEALEIKNNELRKIKHDYGAQISYLYGLCLMNRYDDLKKALKDIIDNNEATPTAVEVNKNGSSLLSIILKPAVDTGIHVIIEEKCDLASIKMNEMDLYRIISNIVNNAINVMNSEGIIIVKTYAYLDSAVIKIENNGPRIKENNLINIFKAGFTTKDNLDNSHGYGLNIVKELVENHNGKINVKSTDTATEFKIVLPIKQIKEIS